MQIPAPLIGSPPLVRYGLPSYEIGASPAAGVAFSQTVEGRYFARLIAVSARLVTDATVADRTLFVEYRDSGGIRYAWSVGSLTQAASLTRDWHFNIYAPGAVSGIDNSFLIPLAPLLLPPTHDFRIGIANGVAGDQLSRVRFVWERFFSTDQPDMSAAAELAGQTG